MDMLTVNRQWSSRPADERYTSLIDLDSHCTDIKNRSHAMTARCGDFDLQPANADASKGLEMVGEALGRTYAHAALSHWSFGQIATLAKAPAGYLRTLPAPMAADCVNFGLISMREEVNLLVTEKNSVTTARAVTGPKYGRVWNSDVTNALVRKFGDGITGQWRVPGEFGKRVPVTKENTTLYASDRDFFVFLCDEENRIQVPGRENGLARGFLVWNSEVGDTSLGIALFLFDFACSNRTIWGLGENKEIRIKHSSGAPERWLNEVMPAVQAFADSREANIADVIEKAQQARITNDTVNREEEITAFLAKRFTKTQAKAMQLAHVIDEGRPIETLWDAANGATAYARGVTYQNERVAIEREAGKIIALAA